MFHSKSRTEQLQDQSALLANNAASVAEQLRERVVPAVESAIEWSQPRVEAARLWAKPRVEHGIEVAAPKLESVVSGLAPKVDTARDKIVEELIPRLTDAIAAFTEASTAAKDEAISRGAGAAAVISGDASASPKRKKKGKVLMILGLLTAAGAGVVAFMKNSAPKDDPWATPLSDPYVPPATGRHSGIATEEVIVDDAMAAELLDGEPSLLESVDEDSLPPVNAASADEDGATKDDKDGKGSKDGKDGNETDAPA